MKFHLVDLGRDWKGPQPIPDLSAARNTFLEGLSDDEYVLFVDSDEEAPRMLLDYITRLKPEYPCYAVRVFGLVDDRAVPLGNPRFKACLMSNRVKFVRHPHEVAVWKEPQRELKREEIGWIDIPIIHNHKGGSRYVQPRWYRTRAFRIMLILVKLRDIWRGW